MWRYIAVRKFTVVATETMLLVCCSLDGFALWFHEFPLSSPVRNSILLRSVLVAAIIQYFLHLRDVYDFQKTRSAGDFGVRLGQALLMASAVLWALYYLVPIVRAEGGAFILGYFLCTVFVIAWHTILRIYFGIRSPRSNLIVLGTGRLAREIVQTILQKPELGYSVRGFVDDDPALVGTSIVNPKVIGLYQDLPTIIPENNVDRVVVELKDRRGRLPIQSLLEVKTKGIAVEDAADVYERLTGKIALENLKPSWLIFNSGFDISRSLLFRKRVISIIVSGLLMVLFLPVMLLLMVLIKLDSKGPIFFRQERVGQDGEIFTLWKFRSMCEDAEREGGPVWASGPDDQRVTRMGRFLRRTRLDELPQLLNVLRGDMSFVGPRPERPQFVQELEQCIPFYRLRHSVKPGITGWAQINYGYANSVENSVEKLQYDLFYVKNMSTFLDLLIILETIKTVLVRKGS